MGNIKLGNFAAKLQKDFGERVVPLDKYRRPGVTTTGSIALDFALRCGGYARGRGYEIVGTKDAGKSTVVLTAVAIHQALYPDRAAAYIDVEGTFDEDWAAGLGVDCSRKAAREGRWLHLFPENSETASDLARETSASGLASLVVVDSVGGMESKKALEKDADKVQVGSNSQVITRMSKHLATLCRVNDVVLILVNQYRANMANPMGSDLSAGPKAMQHMTTAKIEMAQIYSADNPPRRAKFFGSDEVVGNMHRARVTRLKTGARSRAAEFWIMTNKAADEFGGITGIDRADEHLQLGLKVGAIKLEAGGYYTVPGLDDRIRGKENVLKTLRGKPEIFDAIRAEIPFEAPAPFDPDDEE